MNLLSTLTASALHALVARSLEGVTEGPWFAKAYRARETSSEKPEVWLRSEKHDIACLVDSELDRDICFAAQSRDLVPELDRRLRETEAKLEVAVESLKAIATVMPGASLDHQADMTNARQALTRIAALTQP